MPAAWWARTCKHSPLPAFESDHEITSGEDLVAKLRAGFTIELRGSHDYVLPGAVEALNDTAANPANADHLHGRRVPR